jgi:hypothetical protein
MKVSLTLVLLLLLAKPQASSTQVEDLLDLTNSSPQKEPARGWGRGFSSGPHAVLPLHVT